MTSPARSPLAPVPLAPVLVTILAIGLFSVMDAVMKRASLGAGVYPALLARSLLGALVLAPLWRARGGRWPGREALRLHLWRGIMAAGMAATFFWGLVRMPMAEGIALSFLSPLIALWLAAVQLGERIRREAIGAALLGLAGVAVIGAARIGDESASAQTGWGIAAILLSATFYAVNLVLQRRQAQVAGPLEVALFQNGVIALVLLPALPWLWRTPSPAMGIDIAWAALLASLALMLLAWSYARAEAQVLVPLEYTAFGWAALMGWLWFGEMVTPATLAGLGLILLGVWLGSRSGRQAPENRV